MTVYRHIADKASTIPHTTLYLDINLIMVTQPLSTRKMYLSNVQSFVLVT